MKTKENIDEIIKYSARFTEELRFYTSLGLYDINIHAENFFIPVLNLIYGIDLKNLNVTVKKNYPAIDLADSQKRVAFQITSTHTTDKLISTLEKFIQNKLYSIFPTLYFIIIGGKGNSYNQEKIDALTTGKFNFDVSSHILDLSDLHKLITNLPEEIIEDVKSIFKNEFSDIQIDRRKRKFQFEYSTTESEKLYLNVLRIVIPKQIYIADVDIDEEVNLRRHNEWRTQKGWRPLKQFKNKEHLISEELRNLRIFRKDWVHREGKLLTFRNLSDNQIGYSKIVDKGTVTPIDCEEYYQKNEDCLRIFKNLLRNSLIQDSHRIGLEWEQKKQILRFKADRENPKTKQVSWKGKKFATKTVITEIRSKTDNHLICFRHLAFEPNFELIMGKWYLTINSTWSFTNPSGVRKSRFEKDYLSGIKRIENNKTVWMFYRFWSYFLSNQDLLSESNQILTFLPFDPIQFSPVVFDSKWLPVRTSDETTTISESVVSLENDLSLNLFEDED